LHTVLAEAGGGGVAVLEELQTVTFPSATFTRMEHGELATLPGESDL
jgi:hypothetical protein